MTLIHMERWQKHTVLAKCNGRCKPRFLGTAERVNKVSGDLFGYMNSKCQKSVCQMIPQTKEARLGWGSYLLCIEVRLYSRIARRQGT